MITQQIRSLNHSAGPGGWRWVKLEDAANVIGIPAPELLRRFVDAVPALGIWTDSVYLELVPTPYGISIELPSEDVVSIDYDETNQFLEMVGHAIKVPLGWALKVAQLIEQNFYMTNTIEFIGYNSVDELPQDQDMLWVSTVDLEAGHFRAGYALKMKEG